jgi:predicted Zn-dependent protease
MKLTPEQASQLARRAVEMTVADEAEALVASEATALTRFANNRISQNVAEHNALVSVRAVVGKRVGTSSTNRIDDESLAACCEAAVRAARATPADPAFPGLPEPEQITYLERACEATRAFDAEARATAVQAIIEQSAWRDLTAAGKVSVADHAIAVANSRGIEQVWPSQAATRPCSRWDTTAAAGGRASSRRTRASWLPTRLAMKLRRSHSARRTPLTSSPASTPSCSAPRR